MENENNNLKNLDNYFSQFAYMLPTKDIQDLKTTGTLYAPSYNSLTSQNFLTI